MALTWNAKVLQIFLTQQGPTTSLREHVLNQLVSVLDHEEAV